MSSPWPTLRCPMRPTSDLAGNFDLGVAGGPTAEGAPDSGPSVLSDTGASGGSTATGLSGVALIVELSLAGFSGAGGEVWAIAGNRQTSTTKENRGSREPNRSNTGSLLLHEEGVNFRALYAS